MRLDRIYTRGGDKGFTSLGDGSRVPKFDLRVRACGGLDEANAALGVALLHVEDKEARAVLKLVQNELFDVGADLCRPGQYTESTPRLRVTENQTLRIEREIDRFNGGLEPLTSFVLPGGSPAAAYLHQVRTIVRRTECDIAELASRESINAEALKYVNRLSDLLFVLGRYCNGQGASDVLWVPGASR